jgi:hypothetical protein
MAEVERKMEEQESLSKDRLEILKPIGEVSYNRPKESLKELIQWVRNNYCDNSVVELLHNKITIDGSFMQYADENNIKISCLVS